MKPMLLAKDDQPTIYACSHWKVFPPNGAGGAYSLEQLYRAGKLDRTDYQRALVWQRMCGLTVMEPTKCLMCPHARIAEIKNGLPVLTKLDGSLSIPAVDLPTLEVRPLGVRVQHVRIQTNVPGGKVS